MPLCDSPLSGDRFVSIIAASCSVTAEEFETYVRESRTEPFDVLRRNKAVYDSLQLIASLSRELVKRHCMLRICVQWFLAIALHPKFWAHIHAPISVQKDVDSLPGLQIVGSVPLCLMVEIRVPKVNREGSELVSIPLRSTFAPLAPFLCSLELCILFDQSVKWITSGEILKFPQLSSISVNTSLWDSHSSDDTSEILEKLTPLWAWLKQLEFPSLKELEFHGACISAAIPKLVRPECLTKFIMSIACSDPSCNHQPAHFVAILRCPNLECIELYIECKNDVLSFPLNSSAKGSLHLPKLHTLILREADWSGTIDQLLESLCAPAVRHLHYEVEGFIGTTADISSLLIFHSSSQFHLETLEIRFPFPDKNLTFEAKDELVRLLMDSGNGIVSLSVESFFGIQDALHDETLLPSLSDLMLYSWEPSSGAISALHQMLATRWWIDNDAEIPPLSFTKFTRLQLDCPSVRLDSETIRELEGYRWDGLDIRLRE
ncbi:hypothetical protein DL96DRAFT_1623099 [Flagelloscypha sp. PMI_526]|nr:hypothetical protein DL96DRAFT_1623099 [Flagelloscypha sp. PMI_526]